MGWYQPAPVAVDLREALVCGWTARVEGRHLLVPDGCVDVLWLEDGRVVVCGPEMAAWSFVLPPGTEAVGVRFRPGVAPGLLGTPARELVDRRVGLEDLLGAAPARRLGERVGMQATAGGRLAVLEATARGWLATGDGPDPFAARMTSALARRSWSISELADAAGTTERQLQRLSRATFGYSPATLRGVLRLQRFMTLARAPSMAGVGLAALAVLAGFSDQAHLSHQTRKITGMTPRELLASEAPYWHGNAGVVAEHVDDVDADWVSRPPLAPSSTDVGSVQAGRGRGWTDWAA